MSSTASFDNTLLQKNINALQSEDKRKRKLALEDLRKSLQFKPENCVSPAQCDFDQVYKAILHCFSDPSEACRESAVVIVRELLQNKIAVNGKLCLILPVLSQRLGSAEIVEPSEEVRHALTELVRETVGTFPELLPSFFNDLVQILAKTITDPYPRIKKDSCECASDLAKAMPNIFHMQSESLIKPLIQNLTHQQYRVRASAVLALGAVVRYGNNKSIKDVSGPLAERLFDQSQQVREAVTEVVGDWMVNLPDRYSYFHLMIPLMLTSLNDQSPSIQEKAWDLWIHAGTQWMHENEDDIKDKMDFLNSVPSHYPADMKRPNLGCRTLVKRNLHKIAPTLVRELEDWLVDVRIKASQLLCVIILGAEGDIAQYSEQLLEGMYRASNDEDSRVVNNIERAAHLMGYFVPAANYWSLMHPTMEVLCHQGHLRVLGSLITGSESSSLVPHLLVIGNFLHQSVICRVRENVYQTQLVYCCSSIMNTCGEKCVVISQLLFNILVTVLSLSSSEAVSKVTQDGLEELKKIECFERIHTLYNKHMRSLLEDVTKSPDVWTVHSAERLIFQTILLQSGDALESCLDIIVPTLSVSLRPENQDAEMKLKLMTTIAVVLQEENEIKRISPPVMDQFFLSIIQYVIAPNLVWKAGRTSEALRTVTICCLLALLQNHSITNVGTVSFLIETVIPLNLTLVEDAAKKTRLYSCRTIRQIIRLAQADKKLSTDLLFKICGVVLKRLDDVDNDVRRSSVDILCQLFAPQFQNCSIETYSSHIEALYSTMLIHLDDPDPDFGQILLDALKELAILNPSYLSTRLKATQSNFRNQLACQELLNHIACHHEH